MGSSFHQGAKGAGSSDWKKTLTQAANTPQSPLQEVRNFRVQNHSGKKFGGKGKDSGKLKEEQNQSVSFLFGKVKGPEQFHRGEEKTKFLDKEACTQFCL